MVNGHSDSGRAAERALALRYAPAEARAALAVLFALDARLRAITLAARDPMIGLMRLTWWREALEALDVAPPPAEPLLRALAADALTCGVSGAALARLTAGWEVLLDGQPDGQPDWPEVARERAWLFRLAQDVLGRTDPRAGQVGLFWSRVDLALDWPAGSPMLAALDSAYRTPWPAVLRPLGALGLLARLDAAGRGRPGDPRRVGRLLIHRLTGR